MIAPMGRAETQRETNAMNQAKLFWNYKADAWNTTTADPNSYYKRRTLCVAELVARNLAPGRALDVGCGSGSLSYELARRGNDAYGADISENMIGHAVELMSSVYDDAGSRFRVMAGEGLPFDVKFDLITAIGVFPYVEDFDRYIKILSDYLQPGGAVAASCTNRLSFYAYQQALALTLKFRADRAWLEVPLNLIRTGVWSGGYVDRRRARQCHSAAAFDRLFKRNDFEAVDAVDLFNVNLLGLDADPLSRGKSMLLFARLFGWNHIGLYRKLC